MNRRSLLGGGCITLGTLFGGCLQTGEILGSNDGEPCEISCFDFEHQGADDIPDMLTIKHVAGRDLPAEEVFITNVVVDTGGSEWEIDTVAWHEVDDEVGPTDGIGGQSVRVDIEFPDVVKVLWRHDGDEEVLDETRSFR